MSAFNRLLVAGLPLAPRFLVRRVASRYVAGETLEAALEVVSGLNGQGVMATVDVLGEEVRDPDRARAAVEEYLRVFEAIDAHGLDSNVSIKLTSLGLLIDEELCRKNVERIAAAARERDNFVRIDMEDHTTHDATFRIYRAVQARHGNVGVVLQAYMRRALPDIDALPREGANVRLCKGIYIEPRRIAWKGHDTVRLAFITLLDKLVRRGVYTAVATHDELLVAAAYRIIDAHSLGPEAYELQMLLGVDEELREVLVEAGHRVRVYVPYGRDWYAYSMRRLRENPQIARHVLRAWIARLRRRSR